MRKTWIAAFASLLLGARAGAEPTVLGLDDCLRLALAARSPVTAARQQEEIARLELERARAALRPHASVLGAFTQTSEVGEGSDAPRFVALNGHREYVTVASATQEIDTSGRLRATRDRAQADQAVAAASERIAERDLRRAVAASYYRALLARHLASAARDALVESREFEDRTRLLLEGGEAARADLVKAQAQTASLEQSIMAADLESELALHELLAYWTTDVAAAVELRDDLDRALPPPPGPPDVATPAPFLARPEFARSRAEQDALAAEARRARAERLPQLSATFQYGLDSTRFDWADHGYAFFVNLDVPIFDWWRARKAAQQFELQAQQVEAARETGMRTFSKDYQDALSKVRLVYAQLGSCRAQVSLAQENLRLARVRYEGGEGLALDVVGAQTQLVQVRGNFYGTGARYLESLLDLELASGR